jgi:hypothetical protein
LLRAEAARSRLGKLLEDDAEIPLYVDEKVTRRRVNDLAREALASIIP